MLRYLDFVTNYQINVTIIALLTIALVIGMLFYFYTNDLKPAIITFFSVALVPLLTLLTLISLHQIFEITPSEKHVLIMWSVLFINILNLGLLASRYALEVIQKDFDVDYVTRYHFKSTLNLFILLILTIGTVSIFMPEEMLVISLSILGISSIVIWFNHLIARFLLKEK
jgi:hypothetical protein